MKKLLLLSLCAAGVMSAQAQVVINELMQSNIDCIMDDINEFPDSWVELYNTGDVAINLKNYKLGLTDNPAEAFSLSSFTLEPKAYKLVYCDKYDGTRAYHAPFRLESGKDGSVYLFKNDEIVDKVEKMKKQPAPNVAYGRKTDGAEKWGYQLEPTPGKANTGKTCSKDDILKEPVFSVPGQVFETSGDIELTLSLPEGSPEGTSIIYTTDGSEPVMSKELLGNGHWEIKKTLVWENPDPAKNGDVSWSGKYRFSNKANYNPEEVISIIPDDAWDVIRGGEFLVDILATDPYIRVTTGWWSAIWAGTDITKGNEHLVDNGDGTMTLFVNFAGDPILDLIDYQHLLLTGANYIPLRIFSTEYYWVEDEMDQTRTSVGPLSTKVFTGEPLKITSNTVIRAKLYCDGYLSPRSSAQSYIFHGRKVTLPVVSLTTNNDYFYGSKLGIYIDANNNSNNKNDWRRPLNIEYFAAPNEESKINQLGETRVAGGGSRSNKYKTLVLYANKRFNADKKRFSYEFFPEDRPGKTEYKSLMLRNSGNDFDYLYLRDAVMQRSFAWNVDLDYQAYSPAIIYINGKYLGMLNIRERSNEDNIYTNYDKLEDIDMFENWNELKTGTWDNYNAFKKFYTEQGHTMAEFEEWMDCKEFANLMIMNLFYVNLDFPGNNIVMWRPTAEDGRWRWIAKDTDFGLGLYGRSSSYKTLDWIYNNNYDRDNAWANTSDATRLFRRLMADKDFSNMFFDLCSVYMGDFLNYDYIWPEIWSPMYDRIKFEYPYHRKMINEWWPNYNDEMNNAKNWLKKRVDFFYNHLADYYKLGKAIKLEVNTTLSAANLEEIEVTMNDVKLTRNTFKGKFHKGRKVRLSGKNVASWTVVFDYGGESTGQVYDGAELSFEMPECSSVSIRATVGDPAGIEQVETENEEQVLGIYDLSGIRHSKLQKGQNIIRMKDGSTKKVFF